MIGGDPDETPKKGPPDSPTSMGVGEDERWFSDPDVLLDSLRAAPRGDGGPDVPGYEILHELARGGQGIVYLATQASTRRRVALKLLVERGFATAAARRRFEREIELLASIDHPGIVKIFDSGVTRDGLLYLVMELVTGVALDRHLAAVRGAGGPSDPAAIASLCAAIADAVHAAHRRGVIHRDLKPSNILIDGEGRPRIVDFGLARALDRGIGDATVSVTGQFLGSLPWASPEHATGSPDAVDIRSDVYALGVILFQALTAEFPYPVDGSFAATLKAITEQQPARPSARAKGISRDLDAVVLACLAKDPEHRYASAADLAADLRAVVAGEPIRARRDSAWDGMSRTLRRYRLIATVSTVAALAVCVLAGVAWWQSRVANAERGRAERRFNEARQLARSFLYEFHDAVLPLAGSRPAREKLVETALGYLTGLEQEAGDDAAFRADLAGAWERVADIQGNPTMPNLGRTKEAMESLRRAIALREQNLAVAPNDADALLACGRALDTLGYLQGTGGAPSEGLATLRKADALLTRARTASPTDAKILREISANRDRASTLSESAGDRAAAIDRLSEGLVSLASVPDVASQRDAMAVLYGKRAFLLRNSKRTNEALADSGEALRLIRELVAEQPSNAMVRRSLTVNLNERAASLIELERYDEAHAVLDESLGIARGLLEADARNPTTINDLGYVLMKLAQLELAQGHHEDALRRYDEVIALRSEAAQRDPANAMIRRGVVVAVVNAGETAQAAGERSDLAPERRRELLTMAVSKFDEGIALIEAMRRDGVLIPSDANLADEVRAERTKAAEAMAALTK